MHTIINGDKRERALGLAGITSYMYIGSAEIMLAEVVCGP
jgi:hypothetical protein